MGNPTDWHGDWRRPGRYLTGDEQNAAHARLIAHERMLVGMAVRQVLQSKQLAAIMGVSREAIDRRLRPLGLKNPAGKVGRAPAQKLSA